MSASNSLHSATGPERPLLVPLQALSLARPLAASSDTPTAHRSTAWPMGLEWAALPQVPRARHQGTITSNPSSRTASQAEAIAWWGGRAMTITPDILRRIADGLANQSSGAERVAARYAASADMLAALRECQTLLRDLIRPPRDSECIGTVYTRALAAEYRARKALELAERAEP